MWSVSCVCIWLLHGSLVDAWGGSRRLIAVHGSPCEAWLRGGGLGKQEGVESDRGPEVEKGGWSGVLRKAGYQQRFRLIRIVCGVLGGGRAVAQHCYVVLLLLRNPNSDLHGAACLLPAASLLAGFLHVFSTANLPRAVPPQWSRLALAVLGGGGRLRGRGGLDLIDRTASFMWCLIYFAYLRHFIGARRGAWRRLCDDHPAWYQDSSSIQVHGLFARCLECFASPKERNS